VGVGHELIDQPVAIAAMLGHCRAVVMNS
jgi:hypothetical protein